MILRKIVFVIATVALFPFFAFAQERNAHDRVIRLSKEDSTAVADLYKSVPKISLVPIVRGRMIGPKIGFFIPFQGALIKHFNTVNPYFSLGFNSSAPKSNVSVTLDYYSISNRLSSGLIYGPEKTKNRFFLIGPSIGYAFWFPGNEYVRAFVEIDGEALTGRLRVKEEGVDTKWRATYATYFLIGALFTNHVKINLSFAAVHPVSGYSLSGFTASFAYLFAL